MTTQDALLTAAARLVGDLMPIAILVVGDEAEAMVQALRAAGAEAELLTDATVNGSDLALLRADPAALATSDMQTLIGRLGALSDRIIVVPAARGAPEPDTAVLNAWFEHLADMGYQPVVEYDAGFLGNGAFLVDRNATAAETDLAGFTERVSLGGALHASTVRVAELEAQLADAATLATELAAQRTAAKHAQMAANALRLELRDAEARCAALEVEAAAWAPLRSWVSQAVKRHKLPAKPAGPGFVARLLGRSRAVPVDARLHDAAAIRRSDLFDPAWYIASHPELAETGQDPVLHYVLTGAAQGLDPGPWFDTAAYLRNNPGLDPVRTNPLAHAIANGHETALRAR